MECCTYQPGLNHLFAVKKKTSKSDTYKNKGLFFAQNHDHMGWLHVIFTPEFRLKEALLHGKFQLWRERAEAKDSSRAFLLGSGMGQPKRGPWPSLRSVGRKVQNRRHFDIDAIGGKETAGIVPTMSFLLTGIEEDSPCWRDYSHRHIPLSTLSLATAGKLQRKKVPCNFYIY